MLSPGWPDKSISVQNCNHNQLEQIATRIKLEGRSADRTSLAHLLMGLVGRIGRCGGGITAKLPADGRGTAIKHSSSRSLAQALELANLDRDAFFNAELLVRHAYTVPERPGVALSFCR